MTSLNLRPDTTLHNKLSKSQTYDLMNQNIHYTWPQQPLKCIYYIFKYNFLFYTIIINTTHVLE